MRARHGAAGQRTRWRSQEFRPAAHQLTAAEQDEQQQRDGEVDEEAGQEGGDRSSGRPALATIPLVMPP